jgi:hypothetical protein
MASLAIGALLLVLCSISVGCTSGQDFDESLREITRPDLFSIARWELNTLGGEIKKAVSDHQGGIDGGAAEVVRFFNTTGQIKRLEGDIAALKAGDRGDLAPLEAELSRLQQKNDAVTDTVEKILERQIRETLSQQGIFNPLEKYIGSKVNFPPLNFKLARPPRLLVISPRDRIESMKEVTLLPDMSVAEMEDIENKVDALGVSSLVLELGGLATYPSFVTDKGDLRFTINAATEEWLHQYLGFKPLGFRYLLDVTGIHPDYEIATMNETVVGIASREIGGIIYEEYYARQETESAEPPDTASGFDFNSEMREIRRAVDNYLARGEIEQAEEFMEQKRQFLVTKGYYIRKLNQAYFAFYGTYADRPTSISPIGVEVKILRSQSASLKDFLETAAAMTSRQDLIESIR